MRLTPRHINGFYPFSGECIVVCAQSTLLPGPALVPRRDAFLGCWSTADFVGLADLQRPFSSAPLLR